VVPRSLLTATAGVLLLGAVGCEPALPEPDSPGATVLRERCRGCHRLSAPGSMTIDMWRVQIARMHERFAQAQRPWLTPDEERTLLDYLQRHAGQG
jgi:hypothetical protein